MTDIDLYELGGRVLSVFGPFGASTLIELPTETAEQMFPDGLALSGRTDVVDAVTKDIDAVRTRDADLAESSLAASALAMAYEVQHPYNSATSKSMCVRALNDAMETLRALAPVDEQGDELDDLIARHTD